MNHLKYFCVLVFFSVFAALPLRAEWGLRLDVDGAFQKVPLKPAPGFEQIVKNHAWGPVEARKCRLFIQQKGFKDTETITLKAGFIPEADGHIRLTLNGCYLKNQKTKEMIKAWVDYLDISATGTTLRNGKFSSRNASGSEAYNWALRGAVLLPKSGVSAWNGGTIFQTLKVKKGVPVVLTIIARKGTPPAKQTTVAPKVFKAGKWELAIDSSGNWEYLRHNGQVVLQGGNGVANVTFNKFNAPAPHLKNAQWDALKKKLHLTVVRGDYEILETVVFGEYLERRLQITNKGREIGKIASINYNFKLPRQGRFLFPRSFFGSNIGHYTMFENPEQTAVAEGSLKDMPQTFSTRGVFDCPFVFYELSPGRTLTIISDTRIESCRHSLRAWRDSMIAELYTSAAGWTIPGKTMTFGPQYLHISALPLEKALRTIPRQWYTKYNYLPPADRPDWVKKSAMYTLPINPIQGVYNGAAGAEKHAIPRLKALGFNLIWVQPVEVAMMYGVQDFFRMRSDSGTWEEYRHFVDAAHREKMRVLLDTTPHGSRPQWAKTRGLPPEVLIVNEDGQFRRSEAFDYSSPIWREYMRKVAAFDLKMTGVDGFRVDTGGNTGFSWRREGFPAKPSDNVDAEWFYSEIAKNGGKIRAAEYDKASFNSRQGPALLMKTLRDETRKVVRDGIAASETEWLASVPVSDFIWDFYFRQFRFQLHRFPPEEFSRRFLRWLDEQYQVDPPGSLRLRFMELHAYLSPIELYAGDRAACAARSVLFLVHGIPMSLYGDGVGHGIWTRKWLKLRETLPELTDGKADYSGVKSSPQIMTIARILPGKSSVGAVSFLPEKRTVNIQIPDAALPFADGEDLICRDGLSGKTIASGTRKNMKNFALEMEPYGSKLLVFRKSSDKNVTFPDDSLKLQRSSAEALNVKETKDEIKIGSLVIDRNSGLLKQFGSQLGMMYRAGDKPAPKTPAKISVARSGQKIQVTAKLADAVLHYTYDGKVLEFEADLPKSDPAARSGFLFAFPGADRYQVDGIAGQLDDIYVEKQVDMTVRGVYNKEQRRPITPVLWDSELRPLDPNSPELRFFQGKNKGLAVRWQDPLSCAHDSFQLIDRGPAGPMLHLAAWQCNPGPLSFSQTHPARKLKLRFVNAAEAMPKSAVLPDKIALDHQSLYWEISTPQYTALIHRKGGMLHELTFDGKTLPLVRDQHAYSTQGKADYYTKSSKRFLTSRQDVETGSRLYCENGVLKLRFLSLLRDGTYWGVILPPFWVQTEYEFSADSLRQTLRSAIESGDRRFRYSLREKKEDGKTVEIPLPVGVNAKWAPYSRIYSASGIQSVEGSAYRTVVPIPERYFGMYINSSSRRLPVISAMRIPGWWFDLIFQSNTRIVSGINTEAAIEFQGGVDWGHFSTPCRFGPGKYRLVSTIRSENMRKGKGGRADWLSLRVLGSAGKGKPTRWERRFSFPDGPGKTEKVTFDFEVPAGGVAYSMMVSGYQFYDYGKVTVDLPKLIKLPNEAAK